MDSVCHIYKQMRAPYCFDIKIGIERTDARMKKRKKKKKGSKRGDGVPREQVSHPMMDEKFCIQLGSFELLLLLLFNIKTLMEFQIVNKILILISLLLKAPSLNA